MLLKILAFVQSFRVQVRNWPMYIVNRFYTVCYRLRSEQRIKVRPQDRCAFNDVFIVRQYDVALPWATFRRIIDIGANMGAFTVFAAAASPEATIIAVEPEPSNFTLLSENVAINGIHAELHQAVVCSKEGPKTLFLQGAGEHTLYGGATKARSIVVPGVSLVRLLGTDGCDLLKLDCEGAEYEILYSLPKELFSGIRNILLEYHHFVANQQPEKLKKYLQDQGYIVTVPHKSLFLAMR